MKYALILILNLYYSSFAYSQSTTPAGGWGQKLKAEEISISKITCEKTSKDIGNVEPIILETKSYKDIDSALEAILMEMISYNINNASQPASEIQTKCPCLDKLKFYLEDLLSSYKRYEKFHCKTYSVKDQRIKHKVLKKRIEILETILKE